MEYYTYEPLLLEKDLSLPVDIPQRIEKVLKQFITGYYFEEEVRLTPSQEPQKQQIQFLLEECLSRQGTSLKRTSQQPGLPALYHDERKTALLWGPPGHMRQTPRLILWLDELWWL